MEKAEFEKRFFNILEQKVNLRAGWRNSLSCCLKFIDQHKIYQYKSYESILKNLKSLKIMTDATQYTINNNAGGIYSAGAHSIFLRNEHHKRQNYPATFIHELVHALSTDENISYDCINYSKRSTVERFTPIVITDEDLKGIDIDELDENEFLELQEEIAYKIFQRNGGLFEDVRKIKPIRATYNMGFLKYEIEYDDYITLRKIRKNVKTTSQYEKFNIGKLGKVNIDAKRTLETEFAGANEGATEFIARLINSMNQSESTTPVSKYAPQTMLMAQCYAIFGEDLFKSYFTHDFNVLNKKLNINDQRITDVFAKMSQISQGASNDKEHEKNMEVLDDCQIALISLFERKLLIELAKHKDDFFNQGTMREAIFTSFMDYSQNLYFGKYLEEVVNPNWQKVWKRLENAAQNCIEFGNKLLAIRKIPPMHKFSENNFYTWKSQNYINYGYIGCLNKEITLKDRIATTSVPIYQGPTEEKRKTEMQKMYKSTQLPGDFSLFLNQGVDQTTLYCYCSGDKISLEDVFNQSNFTIEKEQGD